MAQQLPVFNYSLLEKFQEKAYDLKKGVFKDIPETSFSR